MFGSITITATRPSPGALMGSVVPAAVLGRINDAWANSGGVLFGSASDPYANRYKHFMNTICSAIKDTARVIMNDVKLLDNAANAVVILSSSDDLKAVPPCMWEPLLTMPKARELLIQGKIFGWGVDPRSLPVVDVAGILINNGQAVLNDPTRKEPARLEWVWKSTDTFYTADDLCKLDESRRFFDDFLAKQLVPGLAPDERKDPTDYPSGVIDL